jgi:hypothetical protein
VSVTAPAGELQVRVLGAEPVARSLRPALRFVLHVLDPEGRDVHLLALTADVRVEPARRRYAPGEHERLVELFGAAERWGATTHAFHWTRATALVPGFTGATSAELEVPLSVDLELATVRYLDALQDGEVPLTFALTGTVLHRGPGGRLAVEPVPWSCVASWRLPVADLRAALAEHVPPGGWVRLAPGTLEALAARRAARGDHAFDATVAALLEDGR